MTSSSGDKRRIGTVEGVALILSVLACLVLFLKILPNLNENADYYGREIVELQQRLDRAEVEVLNLKDSARALTFNREVGALQDALTAVEQLEDRLPPSKEGLVQELRDDFEQLLEALEEQEL